MRIPAKHIVFSGFLGAVMLGSAACGPRQIPPMSVDELMEDRVTLDGVLMKCDQDPAKARTDTECLNARAAIERLAEQQEPAEEAKRAAEFEKTRERLRLSEDQQRQQQEAKTKVDAYSLPVVPVDPTSAPASAAAPASAQPQPVVGQTKP